MTFLMALLINQVVYLYEEVFINYLCFGIYNETLRCRHSHKNGYTEVKCGNICKTRLAGRFL